MDLTKIPLLSGLAARLEFLSARSAVIAENIANADTPDYAAKDLKGPQFRSMAEAAAMRISDPRHMTPPGHASFSYRIESAPDGEASITGNQVSVETQAMKLSQTRQDYALATSLYRKGLAMLRLAARGQ
jgi:flagellar basal-body rod protein FlgB